MSRRLDADEKALVSSHSYIVQHSILLNQLVVYGIRSLPKNVNPMF